MSQRTFPGPWGVEATERAFIDANGFSVAHIYWKPQPALHDRLMTRTEAFLIAEQMAMLPELLVRRRE